jgi:hypothetical protein
MQTMYGRKIITIGRQEITAVQLYEENGLESSIEM